MPNPLLERWSRPSARAELSEFDEKRRDDERERKAQIDEFVVAFAGDAKLKANADKYAAAAAKQPSLMDRLAHQVIPGHGRIEGRRTMTWRVRRSGARVATASHRRARTHTTAASLVWTGSRAPSPRATAPRRRRSGRSDRAIEDVACQYIYIYMEMGLASTTASHRHARRSGRSRAPCTAPATTATATAAAGARPRSTPTSSTRSVELTRVA